MPSGYTLEADEKIIVVVRRHWINFLPIVVSSVVSLLLVLAISYAAGRYRDTVLQHVPMSAIALITALLVILALLIFFVGMWVYRQNCLVLTSKHLIKIEQRGIFGRAVAQLGLSRVQDVSARRNGLMATLLNYGTVTVETAGEEENFEFYQAPDPQGVANQLRLAHDQYAAAPDGTE